MAYQTGSATDLGDLLSKLDTFLTGTPSSTILGGFTQDDFDDGASVSTEGFAAWSKGSAGSGLWISMRWQANAPNNLAIYQALDHTPGNDPGDHPDDSGNGYNTTTAYTDSLLDDERCVNDIGDGPFPSYHFFGDATLNYCHVVVEIASETFRHFGWGELNKFNDWTGGEYCYGHFADEATASSGVDTQAFPPFDGMQAISTATAKRGTTIHAEGLPNQGVSEKWLMHAGGLQADEDSDWLDSAGEHKRITFGGFRAGPVAYGLGPFRSDIATGHIPMYPWAIFLREFDAVNNFCYFLGDVPDIRGVDLFNFSSGQEVTVGSDVWIFFPQVRRTEDDVIGRTYYSGIAYKKVTA